MGYVSTARFIRSGVHLLGAQLIVAILFSFEPAQAEQIGFKLGLQWLQHSTRGEGVDLVYQFDRKPKDGEEALKAFALAECNRVAPKYVPMALKEVGKEKVEFVAITLRFGGAVGTYIRFFAEYKNGTCSKIE